MGINSQTEKQQNNEWVLGDLFWEMEITKNVILLPNKLLANSFWFEWTQTDFHLHYHCNHRIITLSLTISTLVIHMTVSSLLPSSRGYYLAILELHKYLNMLYLWYAVNLPSLKGLCFFSPQWFSFNFRQENKHFTNIQKSNSRTYSHLYPFSSIRDPVSQ